MNDTVQSWFLVGSIGPERTLLARSIHCTNSGGGGVTLRHGSSTNFRQFTETQSGFGQKHLSLFSLKGLAPKCMLNLVASSIKVGTFCQSVDMCFEKRSAFTKLYCFNDENKGGFDVKCRLVCWSSSALCRAGYIS